MSVKTDAVLLYGVPIGDGYDDPLQALASKMGLDLYGTSEVEDGVWLKLSDTLPNQLTLVLTGHTEGCPKWFLATNDEYSAHRGFPLCLGDGVKPNSDSVRVLRKFLKGIRSTAKPQFWLAPCTDF